MKSLIKQPSAWVPIVMSALMLAFILILLAIGGVPAADPNADEGTAAHLFQIWLFLEAILVAFFSFKWLPKRPKEALLVLAIQILAVAFACFPVFYFHL